MRKLFNCNEKEKKENQLKLFYMYKGNKKEENDRSLTGKHVGNTCNVPPRNVTIEHKCLIKRCFDHSIRKRNIYLFKQLVKYKRKKRNKIYIYNKRKRIKIDGYVLLSMLVTLETAQLETSLLNNDVR